MVDSAVEEQVVLLGELNSDLLHQFLNRPGTANDDVPILLGNVQEVAFVGGLVTAHFDALNLSTQLVLHHFQTACCGIEETLVAQVAVDQVYDLQSVLSSLRIFGLAAAASQGNQHDQCQQHA